MVYFLGYNGIKVVQPVIASEVEDQLEKDISDEDFEEVCESIYKRYMNETEGLNLFEIIDDELIKRNYKGD